MSFFEKFQGFTLHCTECSKEITQKESLDKDDRRRYVFCKDCKTLIKAKCMECQKEISIPSIRIHREFHKKKIHLIQNLPNKKNRRENPI